jgi:hypothetical protein
MDSAMKERLLATIDEVLDSGTPTKIERVRLLDLWWRVATDGRAPRAALGRADAAFLSHALRGCAPHCHDQRRTPGDRHGGSHNWVVT